jgi:DNA (cytosine-5)-methyltransferase 1
MPSLRTVAACEIEAFAIANLVAKMEAGLMDPAPVWPNLKTFPWESFRDRVDILSGGYPCQPFSSAGQRKGKDDPRHLWPWIADGIGIIRPTTCFFENVEGHVSLGLSTVVSDLEELGYKVAWGLFSAAECGAPHSRKRVFILAECCSQRGASGISGSLAWNEGESGESDNCSDERLAHTECSKLGTRRNDTRKQKRPKSEHCSAWPSRPKEQQHGWEPPRTIESSLGGDADGTTDRMDDAQLYVSTDNRTDELRLLGNGVVPIQAALAFTTLYRELKQ